MVLLNVEFTWATPEEMFLRSLRRVRVGSLAISKMLSEKETDYFFLPAIALEGPLRVRAFVWVR